MLWLILGGALLIVLGAIWLYLHRNPAITITPFDGYLSPADGIVADIITVTSQSQKIPKKHHGITAFLKDAPWARTIVVIMMRPEHIHTQRAPVSGTITKVIHKAGTLQNAVFGDYRKATVENEHVAFTIVGKRPCKVYLVAGLLARRIKPTAKKGQQVKQGQVIGSIEFGSQVALVLPKTKILVKEGDRAHVGTTRIAK